MTTDTRPDIPLGRTYDAQGKTLTYKDKDGYWYECTYDIHGNELTHKRSDGHWYECTYDIHGYELTHKGSGDYWREYTRDEQGRVLVYKDSAMNRYEYARDEQGNVLAYKTSTGYWYECTHDAEGNEDNDSVAISWHIDDVAALAERNGVAATPDQCREVLRRAKANHNAEQGINWDVLSTYLTDVLTEGAA